MRLNESQVRAFFEIGYLVVEDLVSPQELLRLQEAFEQLYAMAQTLDEPAEIDGSVFVVERPEGAAGLLRIHRIQWVGAAIPLLLQYGEDPRFLALASQLLGMDEMEQLVNQAHFKFPGDGIAFPWHQDSQFRRYGTELWNDVNGRGSYVQIALAIDDMTPDNGPLQFIPNSCQWGHLGLDKLSNRGEGQLTASYDLPRELHQSIHPEDAVSMDLRAGSAVLFGPYTIHRSLANEQGGPRRLFINGYACKGANLRQYPGRGAGRSLRFSHTQGF